MSVLVLRGRRVESVVEPQVRDRFSCQCQCLLSMSVLGIWVAEFPVYRYVMCANLLGVMRSSSLAGFFPETHGCRKRGARSCKRTGISRRKATQRPCKSFHGRKGINVRMSEYFCQMAD